MDTGSAQPERVKAILEEIERDVAARMAGTLPAPPAERTELSELSEQLARETAQVRRRLDALAASLEDIAGSLAASRPPAG